MKSSLKIAAILLALLAFLSLIANAQGSDAPAGEREGMEAYHGGGGNPPGTSGAQDTGTGEASALSIKDEGTTVNYESQSMRQGRSIVTTDYKDTTFRSGYYDTTSGQRVDGTSYTGREIIGVTVESETGGGTEGTETSSAQPGGGGFTCTLVTSGGTSTLTQSQASGTTTNSQFPSGTITSSERSLEAGGGI